MAYTYGNWLYPGQIYSFGVPSVLNIISIIFISSVALNKGFNLHSSKKIHPIDQMSTAIVYSVAPSSNSGARYQIVTTS